MSQPPPDNANDSLAAALARHRIDLPPDQIAALDRYRARLWDWNERLNLTRHTTFEKFVARDVVDSLQLAQLLASGERVLDVGTGGGVPGAVIAILRPDLKVELCESVGKKAKAAEAIVREAGIGVRVHHAPAQELAQKQRFDSLVIRAVAPLAKLIGWFAPHWGNIGRLLIIKGPSWVEERAAARERRLMVDLQLRKAAVYPLGGTQSESVILEIKPRGKAEGGRRKAE